MTKGDIAVTDLRNQVAEIGQLHAEAVDRNRVLSERLTAEDGSMSGEVIITVDGQQHAIQLSSMSVSELVDAIAKTATLAGAVVILTGGRMEIADGTVVKAAIEHQDKLAAVTHTKPAGYDWLAQQAQVPDNGKKKTQWSRRHP